MPGRGHRGDELLLAPREPELHAIAHLAAGAVQRQPRALAHDDDRHVRAAGGGDRLRELGVAAVEHAAPRREAHLGAVGTALADGVEDRRASLELVGQVEVVGDREADRVVAHLEQRLDVRDVGVVAQQVARAVGVGPDHRDRLQVVAQRERPVVGQQHDRRARRLPRQRAILLERRVRGLRVDIGRLEQPELELDGQHARDGAVDERRVGAPIGERRGQRRAERDGGGQLDVDAGLERQDGGRRRDRRRSRATRRARRSRRSRRPRSRRSPTRRAAWW